MHRHHKAQYLTEATHQSKYKKGQTMQACYGCASPKINSSIALQNLIRRQKIKQFNVFHFIDTTHLCGQFLQINTSITCIYALGKCITYVTLPQNKSFTLAQAIRLWQQFINSSLKDKCMLHVLVLHYKKFTSGSNSSLTAWRERELLHKLLLNHQS